ncbi:ACT domain-containing protein [Neisseria sp. Ec49-e6-T10]|uniref:ACT domain-containing protein n=1 Tax=Neisseria sp. Ec49-e6-T10 TaxID=3140744 RepID=UPI003EBEE767
MSAIKEIEILLASMEPELHEEEFVFCTVTDLSFLSGLSWQPKALFQEKEGTTLILLKEQAIEAKLDFSGTFKQITLTVHSSLEAVGLTAAFATELAKHGISANVVAAFYHDHIFVPWTQAQTALNVLKALQVACQAKQFESF